MRKYFLHLCLFLFISFQALHPASGPIKIVITGGPGVGKTTLIEALKARGFNVVPEMAQILIEQALKQGLPNPAQDKEAFKPFMDDICDMQILKESQLKANKLYFLDRGILDPIVYYKRYKTEAPEKLFEEALKTDYKFVFIPDFLDNYKKNNIRKEDKKTAQALHKMILKTYQQYGYILDTNLFIIPAFIYDKKNNKLSIEESVSKRIAFILEKIEQKRENI